MELQERLGFRELMELPDLLDQALPVNLRLLEAFPGQMPAQTVPLTMEASGLSVQLTSLERPEPQALRLEQLDPPANLTTPELPRFHFRFRWEPGIPISAASDTQ
jgi:hypothetical protein